MVATVLKLRYRALGNALSRRPWQLVGFIIGSLWGLGALASVIAGLIAVGLFGDQTVATTVAVLGGSALILGWVLGPILVAGMESTVDATRLAPFPLTRLQVMTALAAVGLTGIPGIITILVALSSLLLWLREPAAAAVALPAGLLGAVVCVLASRLTGELAGGLGGNRRGREVVGTVVLVLVIFAGPLITGVLSVLAGGVARLDVAVDVLRWTPLGAPWYIAPAVAAGDVIGAVASAAIALVTAALLWFSWGRVLEVAATSPRRSASRSVAPGALGLFGRMPTGPVGATWARSLTGWLRDPRYLRQLIVIPIFPVLFLVLGGVEGFGFAIAPVVAALVLSIAGYADISYDGTAFGTVVAAGAPGRSDRLGRTLGAASIGIPLVIVLAVVSAVVPGEATRLPAVLGASLALLLAGYGVCAVSSALIVTPVAAAGDSPFKSVPGQNALTGALVFVAWGAVMALSLPALVLAGIWMTTGGAVWAWSSLATGVIVGGAVAVIGVIVGGRLLDRRGPDLLLRIASFPR
ncbi:MULTISPECIES: hypothetical protein [unclassified Microbacterium]|uniref:hypothetical protein n=1 Tax=unclassified Microbacterium TaxID=2609290 RepID=UPI00386EFA3D